ncbi:hypothetical protein [Tolypothrix sp. VBCCA 56010]
MLAKIINNLGGGEEMNKSSRESGFYLLLLQLLKAIASTTS